jgi:serine/threonine protein kinase
MTKDGIRPLDFEGACPVDQPDLMPWGTPSYTPPEWCAENRGGTRLPEDLYALGAVVYHLLTGTLPGIAPQLSIEKLRRNVPAGVRRVVEELLSVDPSRRPDARATISRLKQGLLSVTRRKR